MDTNSLCYTASPNKHTVTGFPSVRRLNLIQLYIHVTVHRKRFIFK